MNDTLTQDIVQLKGLQQLDADIRLLRMEVDKIMAESQALADRLETCRNRIAEKTETIQALEKQYQQFSDEVKEKQRLIRKSNERMMNVKNNKEYQALLREVEDMKGAIAAFEDRMLEGLEQKETGQSELKAMEADLVAVERQVASDQVAMEKDRAAKELRIAELETERESLAEQMDDRLMTTFLKIQKLQPDRKPVARAVKSVCSGCHMNIPAQFYNELQRRDQIRFCPFCQRILYYEEEA